MKKEILRDEIKWLLETINEQFESVQKHGDKIPQIEFDLLMENVRKFYADMHIMQQMNNPIPVPSPVKTPEPPEPAKPVQPAKETALMAEIADEPLIVSPPIPSFKPAGVVPKTDSPAPARRSARENEIDLFGAEEQVFSIRLKEARDKSLPKISSDRIENLRTAININEKFMFINELFDGNLREYNETIETLNGFINLDQAADFLDLMRKKNFWDTGSNAFKKLKELVERRY